MVHHTMHKAPLTVCLRKPWLISISFRLNFSAFSTANMEILPANRLHAIISIPPASHCLPSRHSHTLFLYLFFLSSRINLRKFSCFNVARLLNSPLNRNQYHAGGINHKELTRFSPHRSTCCWLISFGGATCKDIVCGRRVIIGSESVNES